MQMSPPSTPSSVGKKPKSNVLLFSLIGAIVLLLLVGGGIGLLVFLQTAKHEVPLANATSLPLQSDPSQIKPATLPPIGQPTTTPTEGTRASEVMTPVPSTIASTASSEELAEYVTSTKESVTTAQPSQDVSATEDPEETREVATSTEATTTTTEEVPTTTEETTTARPVVNEADKNLISQCSAIVAEEVSCSVSRDDITSLDSSAFRPIHYTLNVTVKNVQPIQIGGDVQIIFEMNQEGKQISINAAQAIRDLDKISVVDCTTGKTLCVTKTIYESREELLSLLLSESVAAGSNLRVDFTGFTAVDGRDAIYSQTPPKWNRNAPTMLGSIFGPSTARKIFPVFDQPQYKAPISLCVSTPNWKSASVRANIESDSVSNGTVCFPTTVSLSPQQYTFVAFDKTETILVNSTTINGMQIPNVEMHFSLNKNFKREKHAWIYNETQHVMSVLSNWFDFAYPLEKLAIFSAPIPIPYHSALGIMTIQDRLVEYPSYTVAHVSLIKALIGQWIGGIVGGDREMTCFQDSLTTYLEWKLNEQFGFVNRSRANEVNNNRPKDLSKDGKDDARRIRSPQSLGACSERFVSIFYTLDETYGQDTTTNAIREIFRKFPYGVATMNDWMAAVQHASGSREAGQLLSQWFSRTTRPVLMTSIKSQAVEIKQLTPEPWTVPIEVAGSSGIVLTAVTEASQSIPFTSDDYIIVDPARKSMAMVVYDADAYQRFIRCWDASICPAPKESLRAAVQDFGAVLLSNRIVAPENAGELTKWKQFFKFVSTQKLLDGDASCCLEFALQSPTDVYCTWTVQDVCTNIDLVKKIAQM